MMLKDAFSQFKLTTGQAKLLDELDRFLSDESSCFLLKGYAGTGKTFMMKGLTDHLKATNRNFRIAAPTGRAAKVISQKTKHKAYTIHKTIYSNKDLKEFKLKNEDGSETFKFYFELKNNDDPNNTIYIIDEASMLSNVYSEGEFFRFGSGHLLNDLIKYINLNNSDKKIIFIGDNAQLPPVNMSFSPALDAKYLYDTCSLIPTEFELTEVVRQQTESGILHNATNLRQLLKSNIFNQLDIDTNFRDITEIKHEELLSEYLKACNNSIDEETIIIAYSNSSVKEYNDFVRNHFFPNQKTITKKDQVILVSNNYNYPQMELLNGDFGSVKEVSSTNESRTVSLKYKNNLNEIVEKNIVLTFRKVTITFTDENFKKWDIECKIIENLLYSHNRDLSSDELKALYIDFKIRNPKLKNETKEFKDAIRSDSYFNALRIKFGYAVTCHKAQGGEWENVFLNCKTSVGCFNSSYFRWLYTGITRAKNNLYTIETPHYSVASNLQLPNLGNYLPKENTISLNTENEKIELPFDFSNHAIITKHIYLTINEFLKNEKVTIKDIRHTNYLEHYTFSNKDELAIFRIHYNGQNKITRIERPTNPTEFTEAIYAKIANLQNKEIIFSKQDIAETTFKFEQEFQKEFYENLKARLAPFDFNITQIEHKQYHEIYEIKKNGLTATYKFWYDGKFRFKKTEIIPSRTTGLIEEINNLLAEKTN